MKRSASSRTTAADDRVTGGNMEAPRRHTARCNERRVCHGPNRLSAAASWNVARASTDKTRLNLVGTKPGQNQWSLVGLFDEQESRLCLSRRTLHERRGDGLHCPGADGRKQ